jgi:1,4-alpha-glucan branching enzyme
MSLGYLAICLHAHLPFVRHPEYSYFLEEDWYYEAVTETYIPIIHAMERLTEDNVPFGLTMTISPPLISMMVDPLLQERYEKHLYRLSELVDKELVRTRYHGHLNYLARHYRDEIDRALWIWRKYDRNLTKAFKRFQDLGLLEIITCGATHGYLPLMQIHPEAVHAQIEVARRNYRMHFGRDPNGIWLPECGYFSGLDWALRQSNIRFFIMDAHGLLFAQPRPRYGNYAPVFCWGSGVAAFGRDLESSLQVWSKEHGYPGDVAYREFYRDIGYDLEQEYIAPYIQSDGKRKNTGIKYHRITGKTDLKELYDPYHARERAADHAANFMFNREKQIEHLHGVMGRQPIVLSPYDAELYGHWWYEGPIWIEYVLRKSAFDQKIFKTTHLVNFLIENPTQQLVRPAQSSWGDKGYHEFWLNDSNSWIYPHLHKSQERMIALARDYRNADGIYRRVLNQAARELLLAQSSDWAFIMKTGTMVEYAVRRTRSHLRRFNYLHDQIQRNRFDESWINKIEFLDNIFPEMDYSVYTPQ